MPITSTELFRLFDALDKSDAVRTCDNTLSLTKAWLSANGYAAKTELVAEWLQRHGGYCDCEVLFNVESRVISS